MEDRWECSGEVLYVVGVSHCLMVGGDLSERWW